MSLTEGSAGISSTDFPKTPVERTEHHFGPFWEKDFGAISGGPFFSRSLCFTADSDPRELLESYSCIKIIFVDLASSGCLRKRCKTRVFDTGQPHTPNLRGVGHCGLSGRGWAVTYYRFRVHAKGVVLCERTCFCLLSTFQAPSIKPSLLRTLLRALSLLKTLTGAF